MFRRRCVHRWTGWLTLTETYSGQQGPLGTYAAPTGRVVLRVCLRCSSVEGKHQSLVALPF